MRWIICGLVIVGLGLVSPTANAVNPKMLLELIQKLAGGGSKSATKQADQLPSTSGKGLSKSDEGLGLDAPLITRTIARASHDRSCPSMRLRVSLPQLNVQITVPSELHVRSGPGTNYRSQGQFSSAGLYQLDLLDSKECWIKIRYGVEGGKYNSGWASAKYLKFEYDNQLTMPNERLTRELDGDDVYDLVAGSTYKIQTPTAQGSAVAISPTVLLTNCHVMGQYDSVNILENGGSFPAILIHDDYSKDKCFVRSLTLEVRPVPNVMAFNEIRQGSRAYTVGAPLGYNRSIAEGIVSGKHNAQNLKYVQTTAAISPGSSGGGLFDSRGNLLGITTFTDTSGQNLNFAIAAEDFWRE